MDFQEGYSMNELYKAVGISKQCFHQQMNRLLRKREEHNDLVNIVYDLRSSHPTMGYSFMTKKNLGLVLAEKGLLNTKSYIFVTKKQIFDDLNIRTTASKGFQALREVRKHPLLYISLYECKKQKFA